MRALTVGTMGLWLLLGCATEPVDESSPEQQQAAGGFENPGFVESSPSAGEPAGERVTPGDLDTEPRGEGGDRAGEDAGDPAEPVGTEDGVPSVSENTPPTGGAALLSPGTVSEGDELTCAADGAVDADGDEITWTYTWVVSGQEVDGQHGSTLGSAHFDKGDDVWCVAVPHDWASAGPAVTSKNAAVVVNTPPVVQAATLTPTEVSPTGTFTCGFTGWFDPDPADTPEFEFQWETTAGVLLPGQLTADLSASVVAPGESVRCIITPIDEESAGPSVVSPPGTVVPDGPACDAVSQQLNLVVESVPPSILMVVDRSGSMYDSWSVTKSAVGQVLGDLGEDAETGLLLYPSEASCSVADEPQVPLGADHAGTIVAAMNSAGTGGSTPMGRAMKSARLYLEAVGTTNTTVVLAADGKPSDTCLQDCTGCNCTDASVCLWCADLIECTYNEVRKEVEALHDLGVRTFVIGYEGGFGATEFLSSLAVAGGTADVGTSPFYDAADGSTLAGALEEITDAISACSTQVTVPAIWSEVQVTVGAQLLTSDAVDGYVLEDDGTLTLHGSACTAAQEAPVNVQFACD